MTITEKKEEERKEADRGWLMAVSGSSKQLPIRRVEQEMKEEDLRGWTCKGADWELRKPNVRSSRFALCCLPALEPNSVEATISDKARNDLAATDPRRDETGDKNRNWDCYGTGTTTNTNELFLPTSSAPPCILRASILDRPWERFSANNGTPLSSSAAYRGLLLGLGVRENSSGHNGFANLSVWPLRLSYKGSTKRAS
ncbi:hypothetical protein ALC62_07848 [Cyphomyrmex costatus]|uniref:Uncharacterized protein n=1 Tax=Cyphomyrmex costatus TaxID=456900 RepID=A0A195CMB9_9HYME|nr:hypothetical protein ALC62_07848 [Cyphomyrmex costatus]